MIGREINIELCCFSANELSYIDENIRIELCSNFFEGGISPIPSLFLYIRSLLDNDIVVMVRPRGGDFYYSDVEFNMMKSDIQWFKQNGANGFVFGLLNRDGTVDIERTSELVKLASPLPVTFHRAFDMSVNHKQSLEDIIKTGCKRILSSGGAENVDLGYEKLIELFKQANSRIDIIPGGGVTIHNVMRFIDTGFEHVHLSAKKIIQSRMKYHANLSMTYSHEFSSFDYIGLDSEKFKNFVTYVRQNQAL